MAHNAQTPIVRWDHTIVQVQSNYNSEKHRTAYRVRRVHMKPSQNRKDLKLKRQPRVFEKRSAQNDTRKRARVRKGQLRNVESTHKVPTSALFSSSLRNGHLRTTHANAHHLGHYHTKCKQISKRSAQNDGNLRARTASATTTAKHCHAAPAVASRGGRTYPGGDYKDQDQVQEQDPHQCSKRSQLTERH